MKQSKKKLSNWLLLLGVVVLAVAPLVLIKGEFSGADGQAEDAIKEIQPEYKP